MSDQILPSWRAGAGIRYTWQAVGRRDDHRSAMEELIHNDLVLEFTALQFDELS